MGKPVRCKNVRGESLKFLITIISDATEAFELEKSGASIR